ncbi:acetyltransferase [Streptomyces sp. JJ66]|nr:acetyltransferase [Streptomyces sp. JJ66]
MGTPGPAAPPSGSSGFALGTSGPGSGPSGSGSAPPGPAFAPPGSGPDDEDTLELQLPAEFVAAHGQDAPPAGTPDSELLGAVADWPPVTSAAGAFHLVPVRLERDLELLTGWMNDPAVAAFWELAGPAETTAAHLRTQLAGDGRSVPCLGVLDGTPMSYWELYRADLDPLARHFPTRPHDTGVHLLIGPPERRGHGVGTALLRAVSELVLSHRPSCHRLLAEPDVRNAASVAAFLRAGFRLAAEVDLPDKRAALLVRDRTRCPTP